MDIFFSYSSNDRDRVRAVHDALVGFDIFWDQEVPPGTDWDQWIRERLHESKCAVVFWSKHSAESRNVRHEATIAEKHGKLISVLLEPLTAEQFPMGLYTEQAVDLSGWKGDVGDAGWERLKREIQNKLVPVWLYPRLRELETALDAERRRRERAEGLHKSLQAQTERERASEPDIQEQRDKAMEEAAALNTTIQELRRARSEAESKAEDLSQRLAETTALLDSAQARIRAGMQAMEQFIGITGYSTPSRSRWRRAIRGAIIVVVMTVIWVGVSASFGVEFASLESSAEDSMQMWVSVGVTLFSVIIGMVCGTILGWIMLRVLRPMDRSFRFRPNPTYWLLVSFLFVLVLKRSEMHVFMPIFSTILIVATLVLCAGLNQALDGPVLVKDVYSGQCQRIFLLGLLACIIAEAILGSAGSGLGGSMTSEITQMVILPTYLLIAASLGAGASLVGEWIDARFLRRAVHT